jgi:hypothetical protein
MDFADDANAAVNRINYDQKSRSHWEFSLPHIPSSGSALSATSPDPHFDGQRQIGAKNPQ